MHRIRFSVPLARSLACSLRLLTVLSWAAALRCAESSYEVTARPRRSVDAVMSMDSLISREAASRRRKTLVNDSHRSTVRSTHMQSSRIQLLINSFFPLARPSIRPHFPSLFLSQIIFPSSSFCLALLLGNELRLVVPSSARSFLRSSIRSFPRISSPPSRTSSPIPSISAFSSSSSSSLSPCFCEHGNRASFREHTH